MTAQIQSDYISDVAEAAGLEEDQVTVTSIEETATNTYTIKSTIHFYEFDAAAAQALVTKLQNKTAFTRLSQSSANITSIPTVTTKTLVFFARVSAFESK